ncbi:hypothetical protein ACQW02_17750 [Humitalea sp. 24SJ18S-53]|uniref:hypothetical protein n=1 Tax=Humitalea sp. 24SJ18S-53 TaxID=3422307 RepID=UPI003D664BF6
MIKFNLSAIAPAATLAVLLAAQPFAAQAQSYPHAVGSGENVTIDYGPAGQTNVVGGGSLVSTGVGQDVVVTYLDPRFTQQPAAGLVPVAIGSGESEQTVWVPANTDPRALELTGADGVVPNLASIGRRTPRG